MRGKDLFVFVDPAPEDSWSPWAKASSYAEPRWQSKNLRSGCREEFRPGSDLTGGSWMPQMSKTPQMRNKSQYSKSEGIHSDFKPFCIPNNCKSYLLFIEGPVTRLELKNRPKLELTALLRYMKADVNVTSFLCPAFSAHVSRQGMEKYNNFPL